MPLASQSVILDVIAHAEIKPMGIKLEWHRKAVLWMLFERRISKLRSVIGFEPAAYR